MGSPDMTDLAPHRLRGTCNELSQTLHGAGVTMSCVAGTPGGRIFMGGLDGHLHELCYAPSASLWAKRCFQVSGTLLPRVTLLSTHCTVLDMWHVLMD